MPDPSLEQLNQIARNNTIAKTIKELAHQYGDEAMTDILHRLQYAGMRVVHGLDVNQESKYTTDGNAIINRETGEAIPVDEPIFIFRARDLYLIKVLEYYMSLIGNVGHISAVSGVITRVKNFVMVNPSRMKTPDTGPPSKF